ncbi:MAG TPA: cobalamin biosynthesis protein, partial [Mycobacteriales bacterium]
SERYRRFGWAAARLDDVANLLPARVTAALAVLLAPLVGGRPAAAWQAWRDDAAAHPSPNAGACEAAFAGALGLRLGGRTVYPYGVSHRPFLGNGRSPQAGDIPRAVALSRLVGWSAAALCVLYALPWETPRDEVRAGARAVARPNGREAPRVRGLAARAGAREAARPSEREAP